jgi:glycosyltransferase involved in cell wall biosynthesis
VIAFTNFLKDWYVRRRIVPDAAVDVIPIYLPAAEPAPGRARPTRVGFIAKDFDAKGGPVLLRAFEQVRLRRPDAELFVVGCAPRLTPVAASERGVTWVPYVPRERLISEILPTFDVFAYPTQFDGQPLVVLEAMSMGIPIATSDYQAMPELVDFGRAGMVSPVGDPQRLADNVLTLLEPAANAQFRMQTKSWFDRTFSDVAVKPMLRRCYDKAVERREAVA